MLSLLVLFPMVFISVILNMFTIMLMAFSAVLTIAMGVFLGAMISYAAGFVTFIIMMFS